MNFWAIKTVYFGFHLAVIFAFNQLQKVKTEIINFKALHLFLLFPLVWLQGWMQLHNEAIALTFVILAILFLYRYSSILWAGIFISLAVLTKITFVVFYLPILLYVIQNKINWKKFVGPMIVSLGCLLGFYYVYIDDFSDVLLPIKTLSTMSTHGSIKDVISSVLGDSMALNMVTMVLHIAIFALLIFNFYQRFRSKTILSVDSLLVLITIFFTLYSHRLFPWYILPIAILYLYNLKNSPHWHTFLFFISCFYCLQDLSVQIPHQSILFHINVGLTTALGFGSIFLFFKKRLLST
jgi:hypothetical protein